MKSPLLKRCAPPNSPVSHSKTSSIWFLDHCGTGSVMVGTSDLSAAVVFAPPPHHTTPDKTSYCHRGCDHINKNKPVYHQREPGGEFTIIPTTANSLKSELQMLSVRVYREYLCLLINVFNHSLSSMRKLSVGGWWKKWEFDVKWCSQGCGSWLLTKPPCSLPNTPGCFLLFNVSHLVTELPPSQQWSWEEAPCRLLVSRKVLNSRLQPTPCNTHHKQDFQLQLET